ncbi:hypothetical protein PAPYR_13365 [Paratrimastix pyriformis]|uniref:Uncharacterized protein n=1 Tax=Paratrimastix pyriformis TaxID=342808 RepID=A0ABQ8U0E4_9EUKA|nr:hypothetical protein PAPYR_13365 [Paratrimastix pyriformis]
MALETSRSGGTRITFQSLCSHSYRGLWAGPCAAILQVTPAAPAPEASGAAVAASVAGLRVPPPLPLRPRLHPPGPVALGSEMLERLSARLGDLVVAEAARPRALSCPLDEGQQGFRRAAGRALESPEPLMTELGLSHPWGFNSSHIWNSIHHMSALDTRPVRQHSGLGRTARKAHAIGIVTRM